VTELLDRQAILDALQAKWKDESNYSASAVIRECMSVVTNLPAAPPIEIVHHCPTCGFQHIDEPGPGWDNPDHTSHSCQRPGCGTIWRPADVPTRGVASITTAGKSDNWTPGYLVVRDPENNEFWCVLNPEGEIIDLASATFDTALAAAKELNL
jgi:hypothetical protein